MWWRASCRLPGNEAPLLWALSTQVGHQTKYSTPSMQLLNSAQLVTEPTKESHYKLSILMKGLRSFWMNMQARRHRVSSARLTSQVSTRYPQETFPIVHKALAIINFKSIRALYGVLSYPFSRTGECEFDIVGHSDSTPRNSHRVPTDACRVLDNLGCFLIHLRTHFLQLTKSR